MPRETLEIAALPVNAFTAPDGGSTLANVATNGGRILSTDSQRLLVRITQTHAVAKLITVLAGDNPPALCAGQGALTKSMVQNAVWYLVLESARFAQNNGEIHIDAAADATGTVEVYRLGA
jgi:hypothetical protein